MILALPLLGNPHGTIMERLACGENTHAKLRELLLRYGDLIPSKGAAELLDNEGKTTYVYFAKSSPGVWAFTNTPPEQTALPGV